MVWLWYIIVSTVRKGGNRDNRNNNNNNNNKYIKTCKKWFALYGPCPLV
jgi:hypothetical protein